MRSDTIVIYRMILKILRCLCMQCLASHVVRMQTLWFVDYKQITEQISAIHWNYW